MCPRCSRYSRKLMAVNAESTQLGRQRNARGEGARLRLEILTAAHALLADDEAITLRSIARRAGISAPSIYRHFADVDAVMASIVEQAFGELVAVLSEQRDKAETAIERLRAICTAYLAFANERPHLYRLMFGGLWSAADAVEAHPDDDPQIRELGMNAFGLLVDAIRDCADAGVSDSVDHPRDAAGLWAALHGFADLRQTATLFPWPDGTERAMVDAIARVREAR